MKSTISTVFVGGEDAAASSASEPHQVPTFTSRAQWQLHFNEVKETSKLMVIDFSASWCGPCKTIMPAFLDMAEKFSDVDFVIVDVDELNDVAGEFSVRAMPTFVLVKRGREVERIVGADKDQLENKVSHYSAQ
ncbi:hypothetical protein AALP_AA6G338000 [Arabis alpina]|uniref:Thioredoxin domain-containing protein n=1 Tax=Arabis alpina TaxID=50452 RepID=A0A087GTF5_ARAAL|nr:hypothetical protein AALP_AA6G338000 [Arabis alpina]